MRTRLVRTCPTWPRCWGWGLRRYIPPLLFVLGLWDLFFLLLLANPHRRFRTLTRTFGICGGESYSSRSVKYSSFDIDVTVVGKSHMAVCLKFARALTQTRKRISSRRCTESEPSPMLRCVNAVVQCMGLHYITCVVTFILVSLSLMFCKPVKRYCPCKR